MNKFRKPHGKDRSEKRFGRQGDRPDFGRPPFDRDRGGFGGGKSEKFDAICSNCGKACQVPFRPNGKKPVFCSECFNKERGGSPSRAFEPAPERQQSFAPSRPAQMDDRRLEELKRQVDALNLKIDRVLEAVTRKPEVVVQKPAEAEVKEPSKKPTKKAKPVAVKKPVKKAKKGKK